MQNHLRAHTMRTLIFLLGLSAFFPLALSAQSADQEELVLEEVVVTASKREVNLQDLAASIKAFTMQNLEDIGADTFTDYARLTPSLSFAERGSQRNRIVIRGLGPSTGLPTVGVYIDGVPAQQGFETWDPRLFDIERVEILRGPQGTLYGEGSLGGTINIISARPNLSRVEGKVAAEYGDIRYGDSLQNFSGMINVPLVEDTFGIRGVILSRDQGGFIDYPLADNFNGVENGNSDKATDARVIAKWQANDRFTITGLYYYQDAKIEFDQAISPAFTDAIGRGDDLVSNQLFQTEWDWTTKQGTLELQYQFDFANLVANFGKIDRKRSLVDSLLGPAFIDQDENIKSGEVRLVSTSDSPLEWIVGVFFRDRQSDIGQVVHPPGVVPDGTKPPEGVVRRRRDCGHLGMPCHDHRLSDLVQGQPHPVPEMLGELGTGVVLVVLGAQLRPGEVGLHRGLEGRRPCLDDPTRPARHLEREAHRGLPRGLGRDHRIPPDQDAPGPAADILLEVPGL